MYNGLQLAEFYERRHQSMIGLTFTLQKYLIHVDKLVNAAKMEAMNKQPNFGPKSKPTQLVHPCTYAVPGNVFSICLRAPMGTRFGITSAFKGKPTEEYKIYWKRFGRYVRAFVMLTKWAMPEQNVVGVSWLELLVSRLSPEVLFRMKWKSRASLQDGFLSQRRCDVSASWYKPL